MKLSKIIKLAYSIDKPLLLIGEHGTGKSYAIMELAKKLKKTLHKITLTSEITPDDLVGTITLENATTKYEHRPLLQAVVNGEWIVLEELNASPASVLMLLNGLIETNTAQRFITANGETIKPHKDFRLFATANPTKYAGTQQLNDALLSRFIVYEVIADYKPFLEIATKGKTKEQTDTLTSIVSAIQKIKKDLNIYISPRELLTFADLLTVTDTDTAKKVLLSRFYDLEKDEQREIATYLEVSLDTEHTYILSEQDLKAEIEKATDSQKSKIMDLESDLNSQKENAQYYKEEKERLQLLCTRQIETIDKERNENEKAKQELETIKNMISSAMNKS